MKDLIIKGGRIVDPAQGMDEVGNILITDGLIKLAGKETSIG